MVAPIDSDPSKGVVRVGHTIVIAEPFVVVGGMRRMRHSDVAQPVGTVSEEATGEATDGSEGGATSAIRGKERAG